MILTACVYSDLPMYTEVYNINTIEYYTWVKLPGMLGILNEIAELQNGKYICTIELGDTTGAYTYMPCKPWIQFKTDKLNVDIGTHIYRLQFYDIVTDSINSIYFSYSITNDCPNKPYIYMKREVDSE